jgi:hypothetical protein
MTNNNPPDFVIAGAAKSGTTALYSMLRQHPGVFLPMLKEPHYFSDIPADISGPGDQEHTAQRVVRTVNEYRSLFADATPDQLRGDASPSYLFYSSSASKIVRENADCKAVVMLRDPVERAHSHYLNMVRDGRETLSFTEALKAEQQRRTMNWEWTWQYTGVSRYSAGLKAFLDAFSPQRVMVNSFETFASDPGAIFARVCAFLGIDVPDKPPRIWQQNPSGLPRFGSLQSFLAHESIAKSAIKSVIPRSTLRRMKDVATRWNVEKPSLLESERTYLTDVLASDAQLVRELSGLAFDEWSV